MFYAISKRRRDINAAEDRGREKGWEEGRLLGIAEGREEGWEEGHLLGIEEGREEARRQVLREDWDDMLDAIADRLNDDPNVDPRTVIAELRAQLQNDKPE